MKTYISTLLFAITIGCEKATPPQAQAPQHPVEIQFVSTLPLHDEVKLAVRNVVEQYDKRYTLGFETLTILSDTNLGVHMLVDGGTIGRGAVASYREVRINLQGYSDSKISVLENNVRHELFHTLKPKERRALATPRPILDEKVCLGFHGLSLIVHDLSTRGETGLRAIEEAAAELCAHKMGPGYSAGSPDYFSIGLFMKEFVEIGWVSVEDLIRYQKTNGFEDFCHVILKKGNGVTDDDIVFLCGAFQAVRNSATNINSQLRLIIDRRGETGKYNVQE